MKVMAFKRISVLGSNGLLDGKSYIAAGDLCTVGEKTPTGLYPVTYPTSKGNKTRWVRTLKGFLCNQREYADISYPAKGYESATIKSGGCGVCARCSKLDDEPCRFPERAIPSLEAYGVDVYRTSKNAGLAYVNGPNTVTFFGALICNEDLLNTLDTL